MWSIPTWLWTTFSSKTGPVLSQVSSLLWPEYHMYAKNYSDFRPAWPCPGVLILVGQPCSPANPLQGPVTLNPGCVGGATLLGPA